MSASAGFLCFLEKKVSRTSTELLARIYGRVGASALGADFRNAIHFYYNAFIKRPWPLALAVFSRL
ncbi:protein of unknown function [Paraburkholderia dioscoreae]|uniref:Uncharacterized protein n=1 Tax=Paraburkholderia dioscoreae TaxID=2604047 RepID=A0A5Q4ZL74_9BURK|nr:protein of unknown function [Paraburkholderia dioscoreae]